ERWTRLSNLDRLAKGPGVVKWCHRSGPQLEPRKGGPAAAAWWDQDAGASRRLPSLKVMGFGPCKCRTSYPRSLAEMLARSSSGGASRRRRPGGAAPAMVRLVVAAW